MQSTFIYANGVFLGTRQKRWFSSWFPFKTIQNRAPSKRQNMYQHIHRAANSTTIAWALPLEMRTPLTAGWFISGIRTKQPQKAFLGKQNTGTVNCMAKIMYSGTSSKMVATPF